MDDTNARMPITHYSIAKEDRICCINDEWNKFAHANDWSNSDVIGKSLWGFLNCAGTRQIYQLLVKRVRDDRRKLLVPFRCDSADVRRLMELDLEAGADAVVKFACRIVKLESRPRVELLAGDVERSDQFVTLCSWCKKARIEQDDWVEVEEAVNRLELFKTNVQPQLNHGICPPCGDSWRLTA
jgi:hypothetical protein